MLEELCAVGFESHGHWFEAESTGCFAGGVCRETGQGFKAFGHHVGECGAWRRETLERNIETLCIGSCRIAGTLVGGALRNIPGSLSLPTKSNT